MASLGSYVRQSDQHVVHRVRYVEKKTGRRLSISFEAEAEARQFVRLLETFDNDDHRAVATMAAQKRGSKTLHQVMLEHVDLLTRPQPDTLRRYRGQIRDHFAGRLGHTPIDTVTHRDVIEWVQRRTARGLSAKTIKNLHGLLSASMTSAMRLGYRPDNPCSGVSLPRVDRSEDDALFLTHEEFAVLLEAMTPRYRPLLRFLVATGLRWGEATALRIDDFQAGPPATVRVSKAWKRDADNSWIVGPPKTQRSRRTVSLPPSLVPDIEQLIAGRDRHELLFANAQSGQIRHNTFWETNWLPCLAKAMNPSGDPDQPPRLARRPRLHDLRHTHASWMLAEGCDLVVLQRRLGHESITTTIDRYSHLLGSQHVDAAAAADRAMSR